MGPLRSAVVPTLLALTIVPAAAQERHAGTGAGTTQPVGEERRRDAAAEYLALVHAAQQQAHAQGGRYLPLHELRNLPNSPIGFVPRVVADQWSYAVSLKDLFDPSGFALFSDEYGVVYESVPRPIRSEPSHPSGDPPKSGTVSGTLVPSTGPEGPFTRASSAATVKVP